MFGATSATSVLAVSCSWRFGFIDLLLVDSFIQLSEVFDQVRWKYQDGRALGCTRDDGYRISARCSKFLLGCTVRVSTKFCRIARDHFASIDLRTVPAERQQRRLLKAHEVLADLSDDNREQFGDLSTLVRPGG
jgi:hypothetical protein